MGTIRGLFLGEGMKRGPFGDRVGPNCKHNKSERKCVKKDRYITCMNPKKVNKTMMTLQKWVCMGWGWGEAKDEAGTQIKRAKSKKISNQKRQVKSKTRKQKT